MVKVVPTGVSGPSPHCLRHLRMFQVTKKPLSAQAPGRPVKQNPLWLWRQIPRWHEQASTHFSLHNNQGQPSSLLMSEPRRGLIGFQGPPSSLDKVSFRSPLVMLESRIFILWPHWIFTFTPWLNRAHYGMVWEFDSISLLVFFSSICSSYFSNAYGLSSSERSRCFSSSVVKVKNHFLISPNMDLPL